MGHVPAGAAASDGRPDMTAVQAPYVTAFTGEHVALNLAIARHAGAMTKARLSYRDPVDEDWMFGALWARQATNRVGDPDFRALHTLRQRECMLGRLCQVCQGSAADPSSGRLWWVWPAPVAASSAVLSKPPTCRACIPKAIAACPSLRGSAHVYTSDDYEPRGVVGHVFSDVGGVLRMQEGLLPGRLWEIPLDAFRRLEYTLARALIVRTWGLRREHIPRPGGPTSRCNADAPTIDSPASAALGMGSGSRASAPSGM
ncbi:hypothetical protein AB0F17_15935 [Nonomuraea sp. NPDC026600]|uniref:hypothetical protein n=1 Tax=Nonomuraea sp. NPDC026600 TaxID=3155363 RepID=UPI0033D4CB28